VAELPLTHAEWIVSTVPLHPTGLSHEDTRTTLIQLTRTSGFRGRIAVASHHPRDTEELFGSGADLVLEPFQDAADRRGRIAVRRPGRRTHRNPDDHIGRKAVIQGHATPRHAAAA